MYRQFAVMVATATVLMFGLMYLDVLTWDHVFFSDTRVYMALIMGSSMATLMLGFMLKMMPASRWNWGILVASAAVFATALWLVRSQTGIDDLAYMKAMIPHHSIAILTSERAHIKDPRVRRLADEIISSQRREITEMKALIDNLERQ